jgi:hypothetical protein
MKYTLTVFNIDIWYSVGNIFTNNRGISITIGKIWDNNLTTSFLDIGWWENEFHFDVLYFRGLKLKVLKYLNKRRLKNVHNSEYYWGVDKNGQPIKKKINEKSSL